MYYLSKLFILQIYAWLFRCVINSTFVCSVSIISALNPSSLGFVKFTGSYRWREKRWSPAICHSGAAAVLHTRVTSSISLLFFFYFTFIKSAHFRHLTEELTLMLQHCLCGYEKLHVVFVILFVLSRVCLTLGVFVQVINGAPLVQGIFRDH